MLEVIGPGSLQLGFYQIGVMFKDPGIGQTEPPPLDQAGNRMPSVADARFAAADPRRFLDSARGPNVVRWHGCNSIQSIRIDLAAR